MCNHGYSFLIVIFILSCTFNPTPVTPDPVDDKPKACEAACENLKSMKCPGWKGSPGVDEVFGTDDDVPCTKVCIELVNSDPTVTLHQECVAKAGSCLSADQCFEVEE